jgi:DNA-binding CsgD family transcriptional regulator
MPPVARQPTPAPFAHDYTPWPTPPTSRPDQSPADLAGELTIEVEHDLADGAEVALRGRWMVYVAAQRRMLTTELRGTLDWRTGIVTLTGVLATQQLRSTVLADRADQFMEGVAREAGAPSPSFGLTLREMDVARLLARGESNAAIGATLGISPHTARRHTESVMLKLGAHARAQVGAILRGEEGVGAGQRKVFAEVVHRDGTMRGNRWREIGDSPDVPAGT